MSGYSTCFFICYCTFAVTFESMQITAVQIFLCWKNSWNHLKSGSKMVEMDQKVVQYLSSVYFMSKILFINVLPSLLDLCTDILNGLSMIGLVFNWCEEEGKTLEWFSEMSVSTFIRVVYEIGFRGKFALQWC